MSTMVIEALTPLDRALSIAKKSIPQRAWIEQNFCISSHGKFDRVAFKLLSLACIFENSLKSFPMPVRHGQANKPLKRVAKNRHVV